jgi:predicted GNAT family acetyltransferase
VATLAKPVTRAAYAGRVSDIEVQDNAEHHRFEVLVDGETAGKAVYQSRPGAIIVTHSEVDPRFRGHGLANELAKRTLDQIRERHLHVVPLCPFFAHYVSEHPEYGDMVEDY